MKNFKTETIILSIGEFDNWYDIINLLKNLKYNDIIQLEDLAMNWKTCACGSLDKRLTTSAGPNDELLDYLGMTFFRIWESLANQFISKPRAKRELLDILRKIEKRELELNKEGN